MDFNEFDCTEGSPDSLWEEKYDFDVADLVTKARAYAGLTQDGLAKRMSISQSTVAQAENGSFLPSHDFLKRVAVAVGISLLAPVFPFMIKKPESNTSSDFDSDFTRIIPHEFGFGGMKITDLESKNTDMESKNLVIGDQDIWKIN